MSWEIVHLITHPFPIVLAVAGAGVGLTGWAVGAEPLERWGIASLLIAGALAVPSYLTGIAAADVVADRTFIRPSAVQTHRSWATWAAVGLVTAGIFAGFSLAQPEDRRLRRFVLLVGAAAAALTAYAAGRGGRIAHPEETGAAAQEAGEPREARPRRLHASALVVDGHNDLPWRIREEAGLDFAALRLGERGTEGHTDIPRLREGGVDAQFWAAYVPAELGEDAPVFALEQIDLIRRLVAAFPEDLELAATAGDVRRIASEGRVASLIGVEGGHAIANSIPVLRELYRAGARYMTLTHSRTLAWADAAGDEPRHGGLTEFGREVVREMNRLGMLVDLSHVTAETMHDALDVARAPVIFSHSSARALADHPRNVPDDVLRRLPANGGVVMVNFYSGFLLPQPPGDRRPSRRGTVATIADHIDHIVRVAGVDHVGLGSDFDGVTLLPEGMEDVSRLPALTAELLRRGYGDEAVRKILGGNLLRVLGEAERAASRLRAEPPALDRLPFRGLAPEEPAGGETRE